MIANQLGSCVAPLYQYINKVRTKTDTPRAQLNHWRRSPLHLNFLIRRILSVMQYVQLTLHNGLVRTVCRHTLARYIDGSKVQITVCVV